MKPPKHMREAMRSFLGVKKKAPEVETRDVPDGYKRRLKKGKQSFGKDKIRDPKQLQPRTRRKRSTSSPPSSRRHQYDIGPRTQSSPWSYGDDADEGYYGQVGYHEDPQPYGMYQSYDPYSQIYGEYDPQYQQQQYPVNCGPTEVSQRPQEEERGRVRRSQYQSVDYDYRNNKFEPYFEEAQFQTPKLQRSTSCPAIDDRRTRGYGKSANAVNRSSADDKLKACINDLERLSMKLGDAEETCEKLNEVYQISSGMSSASSSRSYGEKRRNTTLRQTRPHTPYTKPDMPMPVEENPYEIGYGPSKAESLSSGYSSGSGASYYHGYGAIPEQNVYDEYQGSEDSWSQFWNYMYSDPEGVYGTYGTYGSTTGGSVYDEDIYGQNGWYYLPTSQDQYNQQQQSAGYNGQNGYYGWDNTASSQYDVYGSTSGGYPEPPHHKQERVGRGAPSSSKSEAGSEISVSSSRSRRKTVRFNRTVNQRVSTADKTYVRDTVSKIKEAADECKPSTSSGASQSFRTNGRKPDVGPDFPAGHIPSSCMCQDCAMARECRSFSAQST